MENLSPKNVIPRAGKERRYDGHGERLEALSLRGVLAPGRKRDVYLSWYRPRRWKSWGGLSMCMLLCARVHTCQRVGSESLALLRQRYEVCVVSLNT